MRDFWPSIDKDLAALNAKAAALLENIKPAPDGLPPSGSWIRAMQLDDDGRGKPASPWHYVVGWNGHIGTLSVRCRVRPSQAIQYAVAHQVGQASRFRRSWERQVLLIAPERPAEDVCRQCLTGLERDAAAVVAAQQAAELAVLVELLPAVGALVLDSSIDDAERGRRLRALWPVR